MKGNIKDHNYAMTCVVMASSDSEAWTELHAVENSF